MDMGSFIRVQNGSCPASYLTRASCLYKQSVSTQNRTVSASPYVTLPRKSCICKATSNEGNNFFEAVGKVKWLIKLSQIPEVPEVPSFSNEAQTKLQRLVDGFNEADAMQVKNIERTTKHDVKALEYFLKTKCQEDPEIAKWVFVKSLHVLEFFHFGCTSEDIKNLAYGLMLKESVNSVILPIMDDLINAIYSMAKINAHIPMLYRTHGQPASPTTLGKEMLIFAEGLRIERHNISQVKITGKFAGGVGNYNAHVVAYPDDINWPLIAEQFVNSLGLSFNPYLTQIKPHDYMDKLFQTFVRFNNILLDFEKDIQGYISVGYLKQVTEAGENRGDNLELANTYFNHFSMNLPISRWQRDLTDSIVLSNIGPGLVSSFLAYKNALVGIGKLQVNEGALNKDLDISWKVLDELIHTAIRKYGVEEPYEKLKELRRGKAVKKESITEFINGLEIPVEVKKELLELTPHYYVGVAGQLAEEGVY